MSFSNVINELLVSMAQYSDRNLIINYLPQEFSDQEFFNLFAAIGSVKRSKVVRDKCSGFSYGFGFVEYVQAPDAQQAILTYNGLHVQNKTLKVAFARLQSDESKKCNLHLENLPAWLTAQDLTLILSLHGGIISCKVLTADDCSISRGTGFVLFETRSAAESAQAAIHGKPWPGTNEPFISVRFAAENFKKVRPPSNMDGVYSAANFTFRQRMNPEYASSLSRGFTLYVFNIGKQTTDEELHTLFYQFGSIMESLVLRDRVSGKSKNCAFVTYTNQQSALTAIQALNGQEYQSRKLQVSFKKSLNRGLVGSGALSFMGVPYGASTPQFTMPSFMFNHFSQSRAVI